MSTFFTLICICSSFTFSYCFLEIKNIKRYAKNYCDGFSNIRLNDKVVAIVAWDEAPNVECILDQDGFDVFDIIN